MRSSSRLVLEPFSASQSPSSSLPLDSESSNSSSLKIYSESSDLFDPIKSLFKLLDSWEELFEMEWSKSIILVPPGSMLIMILYGRIELVRLSYGVT